ncbi:polysaccharide deacetylase family protein [Sediminibacillus massiliensis]|uniref:polysaccharide deacetylase family protein n=1 Tax=Sediminibacillus massiliensis TaxID=1926277 RepID=UPI0015C381F8|nr:polysaccharide deacetylase family protein [Sediminibacillus massiliensis]
MRNSIKLNLLISQGLFIVFLPSWLNFTRYLHPIVIGVVWICYTLAAIYIVYRLAQKKMEVKAGAMHASISIYGLALLVLLFFRPSDQSYGSVNLLPFETIGFYLSGEVNWFIAMYNLAANIGLFVPFGLYYRYIYGKLGLKRLLSICTAAIIMIECTQFFTRRGSLDVDDLILNITGVVIGYFLYSLSKEVFIMKNSRRQSEKPFESGPENIKIPALCYHVISPSPDPDNLYQLSLSKFERQIDYLAENGYTTLLCTEYLDMLNGKIPVPLKPILLTFDDNTKDFYPYAFPLLKEHGMKATQFTVTDWIDREANMAASELKEVMDHGIEVQNHTASHPYLSGLDKQDKNMEITTAGNTLDSLLNIRADFFAFPYGDYDQETISTLQNSGIKGAFTVAGGLGTYQSNPYELPRIVILNGDTLEDFQRKIHTGF